ncbi:MAG: hypothetical protein QF513_01660 [Gammaproteobacteria bacterium]|jgi:uncharacterized protein YcfL|nr:hypothetical protein [Gammaproteobacteria bacterium]MBQ09188.1 hypothetical protein [Gammaproteobacteria bacterium]MDP6146486.1 hypothetical protein [Gammaproteobacteria bacterium]HJL80706.1 hypothetical protein [Gammaproteobacteria bacterium]HJM09417.1 hypothetical protein [Gammaproteobacteria bacterium]|tara:strand:- start:2004 stop:2234 length:231 start_codon:yes stop_codon:yes gene_type:complete
MINLYRSFFLCFIAIFLVGCNSHLENHNSHLENQVSDLEQELAATEAELAETEAELEDQKTADDVWEELATKKTKK